MKCQYYCYSALSNTVECSCDGDLPERPEYIKVEQVAALTLIMHRFYEEQVRCGKDSDKPYIFMEKLAEHLVNGVPAFRGSLSA